MIMSDYMKEELEIIIEKKQYDVRSDVISKYISIRKKRGYTQEEIAALLKVKRPNITRFENGTYNPSLDMLVKIAECLGADLEINLIEKAEEHNRGEKDGR